MPSEEHYRKLERMYDGAGINEYFAPAMTVGDATARVVIPVREKFFHAAGAVHGSVYFKAMDDAAFFAASSIVADVFVLTASFEVKLLRPISAGEMVAVGRVAHASRRLILADAELEDERGRMIGRGSGVFMRSEIALSPALGYR